MSRKEVQNNKNNNNNKKNNNIKNENKIVSSFGNNDNNFNTVPTIYHNNKIVDTRSVNTWEDYCCSNIC